MNLTTYKMKTALLGAVTITVLVMPAANADPGHRRGINQRFEDQQDRIATGIRSGELTPREAADLETKESLFKTEEHMFRMDNGGSLTPAEKTKLNKRQNKLSEQIFDQKHDAQTAPTTAKSEVGQRLENQQDHIAAGISKGQLTAAETARLEAREVELRHHIETDRDANGGKLTDAERKHINEELDDLARRIFKQKHDQETQPHLH
jgi:hypothetical protein